MNFAMPSNGFADLAAYLDSSGVARRAKGSPIWDSVRSGCVFSLFSFSVGGSSDARPQIVEAFLASGNSVFLMSFSSPADDPDLADLTWLPAGPDVWRVPHGLPVRKFLESGFAADDYYRLSIHSSQPPDFGFSDDILVGPIEPYLENLRSHGVEAVFVSGPHFGWGLALLSLWQRKPPA